MRSSKKRCTVPRRRRLRWRGCKGCGHCTMLSRMPTSSPAGRNAPCRRIPCTTMPCIPWRQISAHNKQKDYLQVWKICGFSRPVFSREGV